MDDPTTINENMKSLDDPPVSSISSAVSSSAAIIVENEHLLFSILDYCDEKTRYNAILLSSKQHALLTTDNSFLWRLQNLHRERGVYHPLVLPATTTATATATATWKDIFLNNLKRKDLWQPDQTQSQSKEEGDNSANNYEEGSSSNNNENDTHNSNDAFHIQVSARFKPRDERYVGKFNPHEKKIALPLYQRLALIQMNRDLKTKKEAFQVLYEQGGWFGKESKQAEEEIMIGGDNDHGDDNEDDDNNNNHNSNSNHDGDVEGRDDETGEKTTDNPEEEEEEQDPAKAPPSLRGGVHMIDTNDKFAILVDPTKGLRKFSFDNVIDEHSTQESVYNATTMALIAEFINGFNVSCIVYGQTGSGKTHTMYGDNSFHLENDNIPSSWGIVPRSCHEIFKAIEYRKKHLNLKMKVEIAVSYIEIFGDTVTDLLRQGKSCGRSKVAAQRYVLDGSSDVITSSMAETLTLLEEGESQKRKAATAMNERSSRAHSIFIVRMKQTCIDTDVTSTSRLFLADLGGSEQLKKSQPFVKKNADGTNNNNNTKEQIEYDRKQRAREAVNINLGLLALKQCVEALRRKASFVPYSDSKLTMMLSTGLGGDSKTAIVVCGAQEQRHGAETIAAMKFGQTCRGISNKVTTSTNMLQELLQTINDRIMECESNIKKYERWEERAIEHHLDNGEVEIRKVTEVVGAEEYREQLTNLIRQKMELTGDTTDSLYADSSAIEGFGNAHKYGLGKRVVNNNNRRSDKDSCAQS